MRYDGHVLAKELAGNGLKTTVVTDSSVFAMISRVNMVNISFKQYLINRPGILLSSHLEIFMKVIVGVHAVLANGGVMGPVGMNMVALAAHKYSIPFVVVAGIHEVI